MTARHVQSESMPENRPYAPLCRATPGNDEATQQKPKVAPPLPQPKNTDCVALKGIFCQWLNVLLLCAPLGIVSQFLKWSCALTFFLNFSAIIPLAAILGAATESLAEHTGETIGGLVNATFGNAVEMIITILAIRADLLDVVQGSLMGSILSNLLLVLGMSFVLGGLVFHEQAFNIAGAHSSSSILLVAIIGVALPTFFSQMPDTSLTEVVTVSRVCAIILTVVYCFFLFFQLKSHRHYFAEAPHPETPGEQGERRTPSLEHGKTTPQEEEEEVPLSPCTSVAVLALSTVVISVNSQFLVDAINPLVSRYGIPKAFIGLILLPIVGNAAEHMSAVSAAYKGKMELALGIAVGSSTQVALLVVPFAVIMGWVYDKPMTLAFRSFDTAVLMLSVFLVASVLQDGSSNWLEGVMLIATYLMVAAITFYIPASS